MAKFTPADVKRAIQGATRAGCQVARAEIEPSGKIVVVFGKPQETNEANEWDKVE